MCVCERERERPNAFNGKVMDDACSIETSSLGSKSEREWTTLVAWWLFVPLFYENEKEASIFMLGSQAT